MLILLLTLAIGSVLTVPYQSNNNAVSVFCGTEFSLNDNEQNDVEFQSILGIKGRCSITITAPKDEHVELSCSGAVFTANGEETTSFHGTGPVVLSFRLTDDAPQLVCRAGLEEEHKEPNALHGTLTAIDELDYACDNHPKNKGARAGNLAATEVLVASINDDCHSTWVAGVNCLSDLTPDEVVKTMTGRNPPPSLEEMEIRTERAERELMGPLRSRRQSLPESVDLTTIGRVSPAKQQGSCGSCSVFAAVSTIESCFHKVTDSLPTDLSEQHMLDCAYGFGGNGCSGGMANDYHKWMYQRHNGMLAHENDYAYRAATTGTDQCRSNVEYIPYGAKVASHQESWRSSEEDIMRLLADGHSVTTGMFVAQDFYSYRSGVYQSSQCGNCRNSDGTVNRGGNCPQQNHDITIVGYGVENGVKYWKLKNSWGSDWGENGFAKFLRGVGHCALDIDFSVALCTASGPAPEPEPEPEPSPGTCGGSLSAPSGTIVSEGYPNAYSNGQDCTWTINPASGNNRASGNQVVKFTMMAFELEDTCAICNFDYLQFLEKDNTPVSLGLGTATSSGKICGRTIPEPIFTTGNGAIVKFHSDSDTVGKGFSMKYEFVTIPSCEGQTLSTGSGLQPVVITSPDYPSAYPINKECDWTVSVPRSQKVRLVFEAFITEYNYDFVKVYDGDSTSSSLLGSFSGNNPPGEITSSGSKLHVIFSSDSSMTETGFKAIASGLRK
jgi:cathepsin H